MARPKYDYATLEQKFIQSDLNLSVRQFAEQQGVPWSLVNQKVNSEGWREKRQEFHNKATAKAIEVSGDRLGLKIAKIREDSLDVIHAAVLKMAYDMQDHVVENPDGSKTLVRGQTVTPSDMAKLIDKLLLLTGQPTVRTEERSFNAQHIDFGSLPPELTRAIADIAGERGPDERAVGRSALPSPKPPSTH